MRRAILILLLLFTSCGFHDLCYCQEEPKDAKKAVLIVAHEGFSSEELSQVKGILGKNGIQVKIASSSISLAEGTDGYTVKPDILLSAVNAEDFDAVVFIGGSGARQYWDDPLAHSLARSAFSKNKIVAAISFAPVILCRAGILRGKRSTVWWSEKLTLWTCGANYTELNLERDGNIITAATPSAASGFGDEIAKTLLNPRESK